MISLRSGGMAIDKSAVSWLSFDRLLDRPSPCVVRRLLSIMSFRNSSSLEPAVNVVGGHHLSHQRRKKFLRLRGGGGAEANDCPPGLSLKQEALSRFIASLQDLFTSAHTLPSINSQMRHGPQRS